MVSEFDGDDLKDPDDFDETEKLWLFVAFLNEEKYLTDEQTKTLMNGNEFGSSMKGEWQKEAKTRLGVKFK